VLLRSSQQGKPLLLLLLLRLQLNQQLAKQQHCLLSCRLLQPLQARRRSPVIAPDISYGKGEEQVGAATGTQHCEQQWLAAARTLYCSAVAVTAAPASQYTIARLRGRSGVNADTAYQLHSNICRSRSGQGLQACMV
jgi:hypothetical protein